MRIIAGDLRGRRIDAPAGTGTRPTTDRVRESVMSMVYSARDGFDGAVALDAFAGSGALGLEALSRGADRAVLCDCDAAALGTAQSNVRACGLGPDRVVCRRADMLAAPERVGAHGPFDLVFLDPPYAVGPEGALGIVARLAQAGALADEALVVYEHAAADAERTEGAARAAGLRPVRSKRFGETVVDLLSNGKEGFGA